jgi:hypothetical protein
MMEVMSKERWKQRWVEVMVKEGGMFRSDARLNAERAVEHADQWDTPESAARDEISHWVSPL